MSNPAVAIIGGGAAGYFAAISALEANPQLKVTLFESAAAPLGKVKISGGGRCNVTTSIQEPKDLIRNYPRGGRELLGPFHHFGPKEVVQWFEAQGVILKTEPDGRMFPSSDKSQTIIDCLRQTALRLGLIEKLKTRVQTLSWNDAVGKFIVENENETSTFADTVILASGSASFGHRVASEFGHEIVSCVPSLFTFQIKDPLIEGLAGLSLSKVSAELHCAGKAVASEQGPLLVTHWGLSGPAVIKLSAWGARPLFESKYQADLSVSFVPGLNIEQVFESLLSQRNKLGQKKLSSNAHFDIPQRLWERLCQKALIPENTTWNACSNQFFRALAQTLTAYEFKITGKGIFKEEFVTCGGVKLSEVDFKTMQSKLRPGLYFAGEILDIDALTGGFNFQAAWTTGFIAGEAVAER